jgi:hypothetical protein
MRLALLAALVAVSAAPATAQKALKAGEGAVVFDYTPPAGVEKYLATFTFAPFDSAAGHLVDKGKTAKHVPQIKEWPLTGVRLPAGSYVRRDVYLYAGASSAYCFGAGTVAFEVRPGEATYIGKLTFRPASPPSNIIDRALGFGGQWHGQLIIEQDRAAAEAGLAKLYKALLSAGGGTAATFATEGRPKSELGRDCAAAKMIR